MPNITFNPLAIALTAVALFFLCYAWYVPLFGKRWATELGFAPDDEPKGAALFKALGLTFLGALFTAVVMHNTMAVWLPKTWGVSAPAPSVLAHAAPAAFFTWLGFAVPVLLRGVAWEKRSWALLGIDAGYQLVALAVAALIIASM
jgi:Protein of unknown function (DUF1761)